MFLDIVTQDRVHRGKHLDISISGRPRWLHSVRLKARMDATSFVGQESPLQLELAAGPTPHGNLGLHLPSIRQLHDQHLPSVHISGHNDVGSLP